MRRPLYAYAGPGFNRWGWRRPLYAAAAVATGVGFASAAWDSGWYGDGGWGGGGPYYGYGYGGPAWNVGWNGGWNAAGMAAGVGAGIGGDAPRLTTVTIKQ